MVKLVMELHLVELKIGLHEGCSIREQEMFQDGEASKCGFTMGVSRQ